MTSLTFCVFDGSFGEMEMCCRVSILRSLQSSREEQLAVNYNISSLTLKFGCDSPVRVTSRTTGRYLSHQSSDSSRRISDFGNTILSHSWSKNPL
jgi:hypothetical protein